MTAEEVVKKYGSGVSAIGATEGSPKTAQDVLRKYGSGTQIDIPNAQETLKGLYQPTWGESGSMGLLQGLTSSGAGKALGLVDKTGISEAQQAVNATKEAHPWVYGGFEALGQAAGPMKYLKTPIAMAMGAMSKRAMESGADTSSSGLLSDALQTVAAGPLAWGGAKVAEKAMPWIQQKASGVADWVGEKAAGLAEKATGATRTMAEKFAPNSGRELLDRGLVRFGDSPKNIAERTAEAIHGAEKGISGALTEADERGAKVSENEVVRLLKEKAAAMSGDSSQRSTIKKINNLITGIEETIAERGDDQMSLSAAEGVKRGYQSQSNYTKPLTTRANIAAGSAYREAVENEAAKLDQGLADRFVDSKKLYGLLTPIVEAAEKRSAQLNQSPVGGLLDMTTLAQMMAHGHTPEGIALMLGRRAIAPRIASSAAVGTDQMAKLIERSPELARRLIPMMSSRAVEGAGGLLK